MLLTTDTEAYFQDLIGKRSEATRVMPRVVMFATGESPQVGQCHRNAERWVDENPSHKVVRGWLVIDYGSSGLFVRHSVVTDNGKRLIDITQSMPLPFLRHVGDEALFERLGRDGCNQVPWAISL